MVKYIAILILAFACNASAFLRLGTNTFSSAYVGTQAVQTVRLGTNLIWQRSSTPFSPSDISTLAFWVKPESLTNDVHNSVVHHWYDVSPGSNKLVNDYGDAAKNPHYYTNVLNGYAGVRITGDTADLSRQRTLWQYDIPIYRQPNTFFIVCKPTDLQEPEGGGIIEAHTLNSGSPASTNRQIIHFNSGTASSGVLMSYAGQNPTNTSTITLGEPMYYVVTFDGGSSSYSTNGVDYFSFNPGTNSLERMMLGTYCNWTGPKEIYYLEIVMFTNTLSGMNKTNVTTYLKTKYGIP